MRPLLVLSLLALCAPGPAFSATWVFNREVPELSSRDSAANAGMLVSPKFVRVQAVLLGYYLTGCLDKLRERCDMRQSGRDRAKIAYAYCALNGYKNWAAYFVSGTTSGSRSSIHIEDLTLCEGCDRISVVFCERHGSLEERGEDLLAALYAKDHLKAQGILESRGSIALPASDETALHQAMRWKTPGGLMLVRRLIATGASVDAPDGHGRTPLHVGVKFDRDYPRRSSVEERIGMLMELVSNRAPMEARDKFDRTPLILAAGSGWPEKGEWGMQICSVLVSNGADVNAVSKHPESGTALYEASLKNDYSLMRYLLEKGADPDIANTEGWVPLHAVLRQVMQEKVYSSVLALLSGGADPEIPFPDGTTGIEYLAKNAANLVAGNERIFTLFSSRGVELPREIQEALEQNEQREEVNRLQRKLREGFE